MMDFWDELNKVYNMDIPDEATEIIGDVMIALTELPERKKGKWVWNENGMDWGLGAWVCSVCRSKPETWWESDKKNNPLRCSGSHFCGNCGADMREDAE